MDRGKDYLSTGAGFLPSTVVYMDSNYRLIPRIVWIVQVSQLVHTSVCSNPKDK